MKKLSHVIEAQQFDKPTIEKVFKIADQMKKSLSSKKPLEILKNKVIAVILYEPSTRTRISFEMAALKLGGQYVSTDSARHFSSVAKGETLEDTIQVISGYPVDAIVLRYDKKGGAERAAKVSRVPIINAGDGSGQHPTQALLDLYTIKEHFGKIKGLKIVMAGDLANGRTVRSLCYFLAKHYPDNEICFLSPWEVKMHDDIKKYLNKYNVNWIEEFSFNPNILKKADILYQTRVQKERFKKSKALYKVVERKSKKFIINSGVLERMNEELIILHPLPRIKEIIYDVDKDPRAMYFPQAWNGVPVRMALLKMILEGY